jgi:hypothetical protein
MLGERYVVTKGDNLWKIAARTLGSGKEWPRIWRYNNRREVVRMTGRAVPDPHVVQIGQTLLIPKLPGTNTASGPDEHGAVDLPSAIDPHDASRPSTQAFRPHVPGKPDATQLSPATRSPVAFKFRLDELRWPPQDVGTAIIEVRMTGDLVLMTKKAYPTTFITSRGEIEAQLVHEANLAFGKLVSDTRFVFDPMQKRVTYRSMLVSQSSTPNMPCSAIGVEMSSNTPLPRLRAEIRMSKLEGSIGIFHYFALDAKIAIEVTPKPAPPPPLSTRPQTVAVPAQVQEPSTNWARWIGTGLILTAAGIVVATILEDFVTLGAGAADDPASGAAAAAALTRGLAMLGVGGLGLPKADRPANVALKATITLPER